MFGLRDFFPKLAVTYLDQQSALVYQVIGGILVGLLVLNFIVAVLPFNLR